MISEKDNDEFVARGSYGTVLLTELKDALKYLKHRQNAREEEMLHQEWTIFQKLSHPNIIRFYKLEKIKVIFVIRMELCERASLEKVLLDPNIVYKMPTVHFWAGHLFGVLEYLEQQSLKYLEQ